MIRRSTLGALFTSLALVLGLVVGAPPASADPPPPVTYQWDVTELHPGDTANLTITFTNPHPSDVVFVFMSINSAYPMVTGGTKYTWLGCTGDAGVGDCPTHPDVPIAPAATRTMTVSWRIDDDSPCGESIPFAWYSYVYWESDAGNFDGLTGPPYLTVLC